MASINVSQVIGKLKLGNADKVILTNLFVGFVTDIEKLRASNAALHAKLDTNHAAASDHVATVGVTAAAMTVGK